MPPPGPTSNVALNPYPDLTPVQAQQFVLDNICFSPLPVAHWPALALAPPAVPSSCPDLLLTFDDITMGELCGHRERSKPSSQTLAKAGCHGQRRLELSHCAWPPPNMIPDINLARP